MRGVDIKNYEYEFGLGRPAVFIEHRSYFDSQNESTCPAASSSSPTKTHRANHPRLHEAMPRADAGEKPLKVRTASDAAARSPQVSSQTHKQLH